jgi:aryl-alcohol dehydrogenase-like predicted oxidoreductase
MVLISVGVRDDVVIATKYTANVHDQQVEKYPNQINRSGNSVKSMMVSLEASLKKLGTTYIDVFCECHTLNRTDADDGRYALVGLDYSH